MTDPFVEYYLNQAGSGIGPVFRGAMYQRGHGIGSWLSGLFRSVFPLFKSSAKTIGQEDLNAGFGLLKDTINQKPLKASLKERTREFRNNLMSKVDAGSTPCTVQGIKGERDLNVLLTNATAQIFSRNVVHP
jgi:hypothetical protein